MRTFAALVLLAAALSAQDKGDKKKPAAPRLTVALPLTVEPGKATKLVVRGANLDGVTSVRMHEPKSKARLVGKPKKAGVPNNYPADKLGDYELEIEIELPAEVPGGTASFSVIGPGGESPPAKVAVADDTPRLADKEPNDRLAKSQALTLPVVVDGKIDRERDVDVFSFAVKAGQKVTLDVQASRLGSPADVSLTVYDAAGRIVESCDDRPGTADPTLTFTAEKDGVYTAALIEANDLGGGAFVYRLVAR